MWWKEIRPKCSIERLMISGRPTQVSLDKPGLRGSMPSVTNTLNVKSSEEVSIGLLGTTYLWRMTNKMKRRGNSIRHFSLRGGKKIWLTRLVSKES